MNDRSPPQGALTAFLRGVERRGLVFAELQSGDPRLGEAALADTLRAFSAAAPRSPFAEWPRRFWAMLLADPQLRGAAAPPVRDGPLAVLAGVGSGPRAALLLRLVAGLSEGDAAAVLGIARPTYRLALQRALPRTDQGALDIELWQAMGEAAQQAIRTLPPERLRRLSEPDLAPPSRRAATGARPRWLWPATLALALLTAAALAATWWWPASPAEGDGTSSIQVEALPVAAPAARYDDAVALLTHRDLDLLLDAASGALPPLDPAFDAWLVSALADPSGDDAAP